MVNRINQTDNFNDEALLKRLETFLQVILADFSKADTEMNVLFCNNDFIQRLNKEYRNKDYPTDVLSFSQTEGESFDDQDEDEQFWEMDERAENEEADTCEEEGECLPDNEENETEKDLEILGDIIISVDKAREQCTENGLTFENELANLAIHGTLHLLGFDHERSPEDEQAMFQKQDAYLEKWVK